MVLVSGASGGRALRSGVLTVVFLMALGACRTDPVPEEEARQDEEFTAPAAPADTGPVGTAPPSDTTAAGGREVEVTMREYAFELSQNALAPGPVVFRIRNGGTERHEFEITGPGNVDEEVYLDPGESETVSVSLRPGTYSIECHVETPEGRTHAELGMETELVVR